jgi:hypothetical protein
MNFVQDSGDETIQKWDLGDDELYEFIYNNSVPASAFYSQADANTGAMARMNRMREVLAADMWDKILEIRHRRGEV